MTVTIINGNPLPLEHIQCSPFGCGTIGAESGSKHPDAASFSFCNTLVLSSMYQMWQQNSTAAKQ